MSAQIKPSEQLNRGIEGIIKLSENPQKTASQLGNNFIAQAFFEMGKAGQLIDPELIALVSEVHDLHQGNGDTERCRRAIAEVESLQYNLPKYQNHLVDAAVWLASIELDEGTLYAERLKDVALDTREAICCVSKTNDTETRIRVIKQQLAMIGLGSETDLPEKSWDIKTLVPRRRISPLAQTLDIDEGLDLD